jgi:hypothetical protein
MKKICPSDFDWGGVDPASGLRALHLLVIHAPMNDNMEEVKRITEWIM